MISLRKAIVLGAALLAGSVTAASAADLGGYRGGSMKDSGYAPQAVQSSAPAWYFRLDGGRTSFDAPTMLEDGVADLTSTHMSKAWTAGVGIGYYFNSHVRGDLTYTRVFNSNVSGYRFDSSQLNYNPANPGVYPDCDSAPGNQSSCHGSRQFGLKSDVFLANLYYDIDCRCGFTPYVGAGLGFVRHQTGAGHVIDTVNGQGVTGTIDSASSHHVAGALMAGLTYQIRDRMNIDAGYRFMYLGQTATGAVKDTVTPGQTVMIAPDPTVEQIHAHEFRVGLRYDFR
jgi:opacity protein-like surface antigen